MKYIQILIFMIYTLSANAQGYKSDSANCCLFTFTPTHEKVEKVNKQKEYKKTIYWKRHKRFKIYAISALGLGVCSTFVGEVMMIGYYFNTDKKDAANFWGAVGLTGLGLTASSIPLFIISHTNKRKAKKSVEFSLNTSNIHLTLPNGMKQTQPAVGICMNF
uniref:hypothetical protein n=1 Tax=Prevotella sp. TaxID=59823 RepID=UPI003FF0F2AC